MKQGRMLSAHWTTSPLWPYGRAVGAGTVVEILREGEEVFGKPAYYRVRGTGYEYIQEAEWMWITGVEMSVARHELELVTA